MIGTNGERHLICLRQRTIFTNSLTINFGDHIT
jgi:hypothetical protein